MFKIETQRIIRATREAFSRMDTYRTVRNRVLNQFTGEGERSEKIPLNLIFSNVSIMLPNTAAGTPEVVITPNAPQLNPIAKSYGKVIERVWAANDYRETLRLNVTDALCGLGCVKIGVAGQGDPFQEHYMARSPGNVAVDRVDLDDLLLDLNVTDYRCMRYVGNKFQVVREWLLDSGIFPPDEVQKLPAMTAHGFSRETNVTDLIDLVECYLPSHRLMLVYPFIGDYTNEAMVHQRQWGGPPLGPYEFIHFHKSPNRLFPVPPLKILMALHELANIHMRKMADKTMRSKRLYAFQRGADDDAAIMQTAANASFVGVEAPNLVKEVDFPGPDAEDWRSSEFYQSSYSRLGGNLDLLGGTGAASGTLGQDVILAGSINRRLDDARDRVADFNRRVAEAIGFHLHSDESIDETVTLMAPSGRPVAVPYNAMVRGNAGFDQFQFHVESYNRISADAQTTYNNFLKLLVEGIPAALQAELLSNFAIDARETIMRMAKYLGAEDLMAVWRDPVIAQQLLMEHIRIAEMQAMAGMPPGGADAGQGRTLPYASGGKATQPRSNARQFGGGLYDRATVANGQGSMQRQVLGDRGGGLDRF